MDRNKICYHGYKEKNEIFCNLADDYKCPFNGKYHKLKHKIFGDKYIFGGGDKIGCEVCLAYNCGSDDGKSEGHKKSETIFAACAEDTEKGCNSLAYLWECVRLQFVNEELLADNNRLRAINNNLRIEIIKLKKQIDPNYSPIKKSKKIRHQVERGHRKN